MSAAEPAAVQASALDLGDLEDAPTGDMLVKHPVTGEATRAVLVLAGPEHPQRRGIVFGRMRRMRAEMARTGKVEMPDPEEDELEENDVLAGCILGWSGLAQGGQTLPWSATAAQALMADPKRRWLRAQVKRALDERALFIKASSAP